MKKRYFSEKDVQHHQQSTYNANFHSPSELDISNRRNKANEYHSSLNRLPTLGEVLARKTQSPVDLWSFYLFMKDHEGAIDYLDFWLDVMHHLTLCKHYVKGLRESIIRNSVVHQKRVNASPAIGASASGASEPMMHVLSPTLQYHQHHQPFQPSSLSRQHLAHGDILGEPTYQSPTMPGVSSFGGNGTNNPNNRNSQHSSQRHSIPLLEQSKHKSLSSSLLLEMIINDNMLEDTDSHRLSQFLRGDLSLDNNDPRIQELVEEYNREHINEPLPNPQFTQSPHNYQQGFDPSSGLDSTGRRVHSGTPFLDNDEHSQRSRQSSLTHPGGAAAAAAAAEEEGGHVGRANVASFASGPKYVNTSGDSTHNSPIIAPYSKTNINPSLLEKLIKDSSISAAPEDASSRLFVTRENLRESSHNLLLKYFVEDAEKKITIPKDLNTYIVNSIEREGRDDPDVFGGVRDYVFKLMENELFPKFLTTVAIQNITEFSSKVRMISGLILLFFGFWIAYILLFLDYVKRTRAVVVVPFLIAFYLIISSIYYIDPILVLFGFSESFHKDRRLIRLREKFVHRLLIKRSLWVIFLIVLFTLILTLIFSLVPGHRL